MGENSLKALVTGIRGFVGRHLAQHLLGQDLEVIGVTRGQGGPSFGPPCPLAFHQADLREREPIARILRETKPDLVFHLAAQAHVPTSFADPTSTLVENILCQLNLFQGLIEAGIDSRILIPGSNEEYGHVRPDELPVREDNPLRPTSPYAVSKVAQDMLAYQFSLTHGLKCIRIRPFNHTGPGQSQAYVVSSLAKQVAEAEAGLTPPLVKVGNLDAKRDFTDVRDVVRGYHLALLHCQPGEVYNLGSGQAVSIRQVLEFFLAQSRVPLEIVTEEVLVRPWDTPLIVCDATKLRSQTGWQPQIPLEQTLADVLEDWRRVVAARGAAGSRG